MSDKKIFIILGITALVGVLIIAPDIKLIEVLGGAAILAGPFLVIGFLMSRKKRIGNK